ncbi:hypothetical protein M3Y94_01173900 [Aphelenchoides besseyi]|nr:hypothetical protein M3Y94_01173900 [Aphelenchoides besseyi]KAI6228180.1 hypothetical protein M3Y95_00595100 [Aphelenchoides besseyi]
MSVDVLPSCSFVGGEIEDNRQSKSTSCQQQQRRRSHKSKYETTVVQNTVALAVIGKLHRMVRALFWFTCLVLIGSTSGSKINRHKTLRDVRRNIVNSTQRRCKSITDIELHLLRHLTSPQNSVLHPLRPTHKKRMLSRPPSPNLFDIFEADESLA